jgi:hypothetical protein
MKDVSSVRIPVADVTVGAYRAVFYRLGAVLELGWLPLLLLLAVAIVPAALPADFGAHNDALRALPDFLLLVAGALCLNAFGVRWYQAQLLGTADAARRPWLGPWARFLLYTFVLYVALGATLAMVVFLASAVSDRGFAFKAGVSLLELAMATAMLLIMARLALLYPAAATGRPIGIGGSWRATRGNGWRIVLCWLFATAPLLLGVQIIMGAVFTGFRIGAHAPMGLYILRGLVGTVADFLIAALGAAVLSETYRRLVEALES